MANLLTNYFQTMILNNIEFYNTPDGDIMVKPFNEPVFVLDSKNRALVQAVLSFIKDRYPIAFHRLSSIYSKSERNRDYFEFKMVSRFIRCNFGEYDQLKLDIDNRGLLQFEEVHCPLRGECIDEDVICRPQLNTNMTEREKEILSLISAGMQAQEIADELSISVATVNRHRENIKAKLNLHSVAQLTKYYHEFIKK